MSCLQNFTTKEILNKHTEQYLLINETQTVKYETGTTKLKTLINKYLYRLKFMLILKAY